MNSIPSSPTLSAPPTGPHDAPPGGGVNPLSGTIRARPAGRAATRRHHPRAQNALRILVFAGDIAVCFGALIASYYLRFHTPLRQFGPAIRPDFNLGNYLPLIVTGTFFLIGSCAYLKLYDPRLLLRPLRSMETILRGVTICFVVFTIVSFLIKFTPSVSRFFTGIAYFSTIGLMVLWRWGFHSWLRHSRWRERITQRLVFLGWSPEAERLALAIHCDPGSAFHVCGTILTNGARPSAAGGVLPLGTLDQLEGIFPEHLVDTAVMVDLELPRDRILEVAACCERHYVDFKIIPSFFQIFISSLQMQTVSGVPLLGVETLPLNSVLNRVIKRTVDIVGALVGLAGSIPIMLLLALLIKRQDPGPVVYRQVRTGRHGRPFTMYKLRSMRLDAETGSGPQWAVPDDPRRLRIGVLMREWNLDELPQFWNVLKGEMSLVGPRPERPELIERFEKTIKNYHPRHEVRPGLTGWAQVNGLRGNTSLEERIRHDLFYIENWTLLLDLRILVLTFLRRKNAY